MKTWFFEMKTWFFQMKLDYRRIKFLFNRIKIFAKSQVFTHVFKFAKKYDVIPIGHRMSRRTRLGNLRTLTPLET